MRIHPAMPHQTSDGTLPSLLTAVLLALSGLGRLVLLEVVGVFPIRTTDIRSVLVSHLLALFGHKCLSDSCISAI